MQIFTYVLLGFAGGFVGGTFGVGGGTIMVPALLLLFNMTQHQAQGTSLAIMLPPVTLFAVLRYYYQGHVKINIAVFAALGFFIGAFIGAHLIQTIPDANLKRAFGVFLIIVGVKIALLK